MHPLVFFPGAGGRASFWQPVADRLSYLGPIQLLAWPGFGDVPADPTIDELREKLSASPIHARVVPYALILVITSLVQDAFGPNSHDHLPRCRSCRVDGQRFFACARRCIPAQAF